MWEIRVGWSGKTTEWKVNLNLFPRTSWFRGVGGGTIVLFHACFVEIFSLQSLLYLPFWNFSYPSQLCPDAFVSPPPHRPQYSSLVLNACFLYFPNKAGLVTLEGLLEILFILFYESKPPAHFRQSATSLLPLHLAKPSYPCLYLSVPWVLESHRALLRGGLGEGERTFPREGASRSTVAT